jgi:hypothetical protein
MSFMEGGKRIPALRKGLKVVADMYVKPAYADVGRGILAARFLNHNDVGGNDTVRTRLATS